MMKGEEETYCVEGGGGLAEREKEQREEGEEGRGEELHAIVSRRVTG